MIRPTGNRVIVKEIPKTKETKTGIILPKDHKELLDQGIIMAVGPGRILNNGEFISTNINVKDHVYFIKANGIEITVDDDQYILIDRQHILAIIASEIN